MVADVAEGARVYHVAVQIGRYQGTFREDLAAHELDKGRAELYRSVVRETLMTREEIDARYAFSQEGPRSLQWEEDEEGTPVLVPLERADYCGYVLTLRPRRTPQRGAVAIVRQPIEGDEFGVEGLHRALHAAMVARHGAWPSELRLAHTHYADYLNALHDLIPYHRDEPGEGVRFCGIPLRAQRYAPPMTLLAVYPLTGIGD